ncbi:hypothetical protein Poly30_08190 [Planctomycetes bacterium Poly30]|uniref:Right handed beta helix domain-containing protein n=1 Tax=Saltatorellus ferox TaxID=2528018 RepID=A0A518EMK7_9BACT|nr:hypothetical protein Poly30_08190 [Planctomycetes bacterium Poly30]
MLALPMLLVCGVLDVDSVAGPFFEVRDAVSAAASGDIIRVAPGNYSYFGIFGKEITIVNSSASGEVRVSGTVRIQGIGPGEQVLLDGIDIEAAPGSGDPALLLAHCDGSVRLQDGEFHGMDVAGVRLLDCSDVVLTNCTALSDSGSAVHATSSHLTLGGGAYFGASFELQSFYAGRAGAAGLYLEGGTTFVSGSTVVGGSGGEGLMSAFGCWPEPGPGGNGVTAIDTDVEILGAMVLGGEGGVGFNCLNAEAGVPVALLGGATETAHPGAAVRLDIGPAIQQEGGTLVAIADGDAGSPLLLVVGLRAGRSNLPAGFVGELFIGGPLGSQRRVFLGAAPASLPLTLPELSPFGIAEFEFQAVQLRATAAVTGEVRGLRVLDRGW